MASSVRVGGAEVSASAAACSASSSAGRTGGSRRGWRHRGPPLPRDSASSASAGGKVRRCAASAGQRCRAQGAARRAGEALGRAAPARAAGSALMRHTRSPQPAWRGAQAWLGWREILKINRARARGHLSGGLLAVGNVVPGREFRRLQRRRRRRCGARRGCAFLCSAAPRAAQQRHLLRFRPRGTAQQARQPRRRGRRGRPGLSAG
jgi:hypothetical protein